MDEAKRLSTHQHIDQLHQSRPAKGRKGVFAGCH